MGSKARRVAERYFDRDEVERLIPQLTRIMERVMAAQTAATESKQWLQEEQRRIEQSGGGMIDQRAWKAASERVERGARDVRQGLEQVQALGGAPKDLGLGLVDFLHLRDGREVNLCWRYGEQKITHWHGLDEGYSSRKPL
jgi:hypothetical protein